MDHDNQPSAQATETQAEAPQNEGFQARINELTAQKRQAEEALKERERQLMEQTARMAEQALIQSQQARPAPAAPVDPLSQFKDQLDPVVSQAISAAIAETQRRMEAQYAPQFKQQAAQIAAYAVQAEVQNVPGVPKEVAQRAAQLAANWRAAGLDFPPGDALNFAMGEHYRNQLLKAAPVAGYNPAAQMVPNVVQGFAPAPAAAPRGLPANFDSLTRQQQNDLLEKSGLLDQPL